MSVIRKNMFQRHFLWLTVAIAGLILALLASAVLTFLPQREAGIRLGSRTGSSNLVGVTSHTEGAPNVKGAVEPPASSAGKPPSAPAAVTDRATVSQSVTLPPIASLGTLVDRMIVKTGTLNLRVPDLHEAVQKISGVVESIPGAYVASSSTSYRGEPVALANGADSRVIMPPIPVPPTGLSATVTVKVPADAFDSALQRLRALGTPLAETISTQEVTEEYVDLEAQVRALEATEQQYIRLLDRANRIEEILPIQQRITEVRSQIDRLRGRMNLLQRRADLSTITVSLTAASGAATTSAGEPRFVQTLRLAVSSLSAVLWNVLDVVIYVAVYALPLLPLVLILRWWRGRNDDTRQPSPSAGGAVS